MSVGEGCIISERTSVGVLEPGEDSKKGVVLGKGVVLETGAVVEGVLGEGTVVDVGGKVGAGCVVGKVN